MLRCQAAAVRSQHTRGMRLVDIEMRAEFIRQCDQVAERRAVAIHAEDGLGDDQAPARLAPIALQQRTQMIEIVVAKPLLPQPRRGDAMMQAGVVQAVGIDQRLAQQFRHGRQDGGIGLEPGIEHQRRLRALEGGELLLDRDIGIQRPGDEARRAGPRAIPLSPLARPRDQLRMAAEAEIVVAGKIDQPRAVSTNDVGALAPIRAQAPQPSAFRQFGEARFRQLIQSASHDAAQAAARCCDQAETWRTIAWVRRDSSSVEITNGGAT